jgi:hypothetical protein
LLAKHSLGGGCARYVFGGNTEEVRKGIEAAVQKANDLNLLVTAAQGERSNSVVNRILAKYKGDTNSSIVSKYTAEVIGKIMQPEAFERSARCMRTLIKR